MLIPSLSSLLQTVFCKFLLVSFVQPEAKILATIFKKSFLLHCKQQLKSCEIGLMCTFLRLFTTVTVCATLPRLMTLEAHRLEPCHSFCCTEQCRGAEGRKGLWRVRCEILRNSHAPYAGSSKMPGKR